MPATVGAPDSVVDDRASVNRPSQTLSQLPELELTRVICDGHAGKVLEGRMMGTPIIVKSADTAHSPMGKQLLENEAKVALKLSPLLEKVVPLLLGSGYFGPCFFANAIEKVKGRSVRKQEKRKALAALRQVHARGVLHGDVKAENFVVTKDGRVFVMDFGLSRLTSDAARFGAEELAIEAL